MSSSFNWFAALRAIPAIVALILAAGCDEPVSDSSRTAGCSETSDPIQLTSKLDDDDGDGNPIDEDFPTINDEDDDIADHAWVRDPDGVYHFFFHTESLFHPSQIEHYTSVDLVGLDYVGVALTVNPGGWDSDALWAPHIVESSSAYYMFYTGVEGSGTDARQRIGAAISSDLMTWTRLAGNRCPGTSGDGCVYECKECWTTWGAPGGGAYDHQCRDPFVIRDAAHRRWLLFATAKSVNQFGVVTVARSQDLVAWTGEGFIGATRRLPGGIGAQTTGGQAENPFVVGHAGTNYLFFTDWEDPEDSVSVDQPRTIVQYATSPTLGVDTTASTNWVYRGYIPDPGVNAIEVFRIGGVGHWVMSQSISNPNSGVTKKHRREVRLKCVIWRDDSTFETWNLEPPPAPGWFPPLGPQE